MKKTLKIVPASLLAVCALVSCNNNNSGDSTTSTPVAKKTLTEFVNELNDGEQSKETIDALLEDTDLLASNDSLITASQYYVDDYWPAEGLQEQYREQYTHALEVTEQFFRYENNVVATTTDYSYKGYDATTEDNFSKATEFTGVGYLYEDSDGATRYTYTQDEDPENGYSFSYAKKISEEDKASFYNAGGISDFVSSYAAQVGDDFDYYYDYYSSSDSFIWGDDYSAVKEGNKLTVVYNKSFTLYYSMKTNWSEYGSEWDHIYASNTYLYEYVFTIEDGVITYGQFIDNGFNSVYYEDTAKALTPTTTSALSKSDVEKMTLTIPETIVDPETMEPIKNPRNDPNAVYQLQDFISTFVIVKSTAKSNGKFDLTKLPDATKYRSDVDETDTGAWIDVKDLLACDEVE